MPTSSVDILPTLIHLTGGEPPGWCEGQVLPAFGGADISDQSLFMMEGRTNRAFQPLTRATFALRKGQHKLIYYKGYEQYDRRDTFEMYDIDNDPGELNDLYSESLALAKDLRTELLARVESENANFKGAG